MLRPRFGRLDAEYVYGRAPACQVSPVMKPASLVPKSVMNAFGFAAFNDWASCLNSSQVVGTFRWYLVNRSCR